MQRHSRQIALPGGLVLEVRAVSRIEEERP